MNSLEEGTGNQEEAPENQEESPEIEDAQNREEAQEIDDAKNQEETPETEGFENQEAPEIIDTETQEEALDNDGAGNQEEAPEIEITGNREEALENEGAGQEDSLKICAENRLETPEIEDVENREEAQEIDNVENQEDPPEIEGAENREEAAEESTEILGENDEVEDGKESSNSDRIDQDDKEDDEEKDKRPTRRVIIDSDDEEKNEEEHDLNEQESEKEELDDEEKPKEAGDVSELMQNIFGEDMSDDDEEKEGTSGKVVHGSDNEEDEPKLLRVERSDDEDDNFLGRKWDFDEMMAKKKLERRRRRRRDGSIDLMADADDQIKALVDAMNEAAAEDRKANIDRRPAIRKRKMLPIVKNTLLKVDLFEAMLDNGMVSAISEWLAPLPDKSLVALEIRCSLLKILERWPNLEQSTLKQSGLGRAVMYLFKHPKETRENKLIASKLIREWSRPIFQLESDFRSLSKEERVQRDYSQMPLAKRKRLSVDDESGIPIFSGSNKLHDDDGPKHPGEPGFIPRARVPKPSTKDYVVRPRPEIEGQFRGETKSKQISRLARTQRQFQQKNSANTLKRAIGVSISGKNL